MDFGTWVVLVTLGPIIVAAIGCALFMWWEDRDMDRFYRELNSRSTTRKG